MINRDSSSIRNNHTRLRPNDGKNIQRNNIVNYGNIRNYSRDFERPLGAFYFCLIFWRAVLTRAFFVSYAIRAFCFVSANLMQA